MEPHRRFDLWIARSGMSRNAIALELGVCRSVITYWCGGHRRPSLKSAQAIQFLTKGKVPVKSWGHVVNAKKRGPRELQGYLLKNGTTAFALAEILGVAPTTTHYWVKGVSVPNDENRRRLSRLLKVKLSPEDF